MSTRKQEVLALVCKGKANKVIAHELGMAEATVKVHVRDLMASSGATNRTELALQALGILSQRRRHQAWPAV